MRTYSSGMQRNLYLQIAQALVFSVLVCTVPLAAQSEEEAVRRAALDYVEGIYEAKPEYIERSVLPELAKRGFWFNEKQNQWQLTLMPYERLVALAKTWNQGRKDRAEWPKEVRVFEVQSHTASAKVVAEWGVDYLQLVKADGTWKIAHIVWQSLPKAKKSGS